MLIFIEVEVEFGVRILEDSCFQAVSLKRRKLIFMATMILILKVE